MAARGETSAEKVRRFVVERIELAGLRVEYAEVVDKDSLKPLERIEDEAQLLLAAYSGSVRLIDNVRLSCKAGIG
jgi:pantothenate synthetase